MVRPAAPSHGLLFDVIADLPEGIAVMPVFAADKAEALKAANPPPRGAAAPSAVGELITKCDPKSARLPHNISPYKTAPL